MPFFSPPLINIRSSHIVLIGMKHASTNLCMSLHAHTGNPSPKQQTSVIRISPRDFNHHVIEN